MIPHPTDLQKHVLSTYLTLRMGIGIIAVVFPFVLWAGEAFFGVAPAMKGSLSVYYHSSMRDVFVGVLFAIGGLLYLYKGFSTQENIALNLAGVFAVAVALLPTKIPESLRIYLSECACSREPFTATPLHTLCALAFFACIAYVCAFRASDTLYLIGDAKRERYYAGIYKSLGAALVIVPAIAAVLLYFVQLDLAAAQRTMVFVVETLAIWIFAAYWLVKGREIAKTNADVVAASCAMPPLAR